MKILIFLVSIYTLTGCYQTENGLTFGKPSYESRDIDVTENDLKILERADELLSEENWVKDSRRICSESRKLNLYCALEKASIEVNGKYNHRQAALQEVRFAIDDHYRSYWSKHRLGDFNGNKLTTFSDIKRVMAVASQRVKSKLKHSGNASRTCSSPALVNTF
ncbi:MAG: DUF6197 family protein [Thiotrichales bacterium]